MSKKFSSPFSKVFFVKGKEGKRASRSFSAGCERAWADPERRREPTTGRNQGKTPAQRQHAERKQTRQHDANPKQDQKSETRTEDEAKDGLTDREHRHRHGNTQFLWPSISWFSGFLPFLALSRIFANAEIPEKEKFTKNSFPFREKSGERQTRNFLEAIKQWNTRNAKTAQIPGSIKPNLLNTDTAFTIQCNTGNLKTAKTYNWTEI